jgi:hypothetical protein
MRYDNIDQYMIDNKLNGKQLAGKLGSAACLFGAPHINADNPGEELAF